jgi:Ca-activated chloride channel family protein
VVEFHGDLLEALQAFHFLRPWWLLAMPLAWYIKRALERRAVQSDWREHIDPTLLEALLLRPAEEARLTPRRLATVMMLIWVLALAGPSWQRQPSPLSENQAPLVIALHLSESMLQRDLRPSRLAHAKHKLSDLLRRRPGAPVALVVYGGSAHTVLPLTEDHDVVDLYLRSLHPEILPEPGNRTDLALTLSADLLGDGGGSVLLVSDQVTSVSVPELLDVQMLLVTPLGVDTLNPSTQVATTGITLDNGDLEQLLNGIRHRWQNRLDETEQAQWRDCGYYLLWPLMGLMLLWFRRGMVLPW